MCLSAQTVAFVIGIIVLARMVSKLSIQWGVEATYFFVAGTVTYVLASMCILQRPVKSEAIRSILAMYLMVEIGVYACLQVLIHTGPLLARRGWWCCCTEHLRLIDWSHNCVIYSRYNDGSGKSALIRKAEAPAYFMILPFAPQVSEFRGCALFFPQHCSATTTA